MLVERQGKEQHPQNFKRRVQSTDPYVPLQDIKSVGNWQDFIDTIAIINSVSCYNSLSIPLLIKKEAQRISPSVWTSYRNPESLWLHTVLASKLPEPKGANYSIDVL